MAFLGGGSVLPMLGNLLFGGLGLIAKPFGSGKKAPLQPRPVTTNADVTQSEADDALRRRQGGAADMITGTRGATAAAGSIGRLVVGS